MQRLPVRPAFSKFTPRFGLALMAGLAAFLLAGCGRRSGAESGGAATTIVFKHSKFFGDPDAFDALLRRFERENPGFRVKSEALPNSSDEQHQFYVINLQARSADFDVLALDVVWGAEFARAGWLREIGPWFSPDEQQQFFRGPLEAVTYEGKVYAVPWFVDAGLLYYRKDLLEALGLGPPQTWEELVADARRVQAEHPGRYGFVWQGKQYEGLVCNALEYLWSNGGAVLRDGRVVIDSPENRTALAFMRGLIREDHVSPPLVTTLTEEPSRNLFGNGKSIFLRNWPYAWSLFQQPDSAVKGKVGVAVLPHFPGHESAATLGGWQLGINAYSRHPEAAERFIRFLTSYDAQKALAMAYAMNPTRKKLYQDPDLIAAQPFTTRLYDVFEHARPRPVTPYYVMISQVLQSEFSAVLVDRKTPEAALAAAQAQIEQILKRTTAATPGP
jgi:multiple sugar transport system substrate-binding protein